jgi:hypothetical protein
MERFPDDAEDLFADFDPNPIRVTMVLADHAQAADGKLNIIGGGWTIIGPDPTPFAIALIIEVPWALTDQKHTFRMELIDQDGNTLRAKTDDGEQEIALEGDFTVDRPDGVPFGTPFSVPVAINMPSPPPIPPGGRYEWRLEINHKTHADWRLGFNTRETDVETA